MPPQSASADEGAALWVVYSAAGVGVALAAFVVGYVLGTKRVKSQADDTTQSPGKRARKVPPPPKSRSRVTKGKHPSEVQGQPFFCETIDDDDKDLEANAQRQGEHRREDARTELEVAVVLAERTDLLEAAVEAATIPPTNDAVRAAVADAKTSIPKIATAAEAAPNAECPMALWRSPPPPTSARRLPAGSWFGPDHEGHQNSVWPGSRRASENSHTKYECDN